MELLPKVIDVFTCGAEPEVQTSQVLHTREIWQAFYSFAALEAKSSQVFQAD